MLRTEYKINVGSFEETRRKHIFTIRKFHGYMMRKECLEYLILTGTLKLNKYIYLAYVVIENENCDPGIRSSII